LDQRFKNNFVAQRTDMLC